MKLIAVLFLSLSSLANAADYYKCYNLKTYLLENSGVMKETHDWGEKGVPSFTVDLRNGEYRYGNLETAKLEIIQSGDKDNSFLAIKPESISRYGFQLLIKEFVEGSKKPYIRAGIFPIGYLNTGYCRKF